MADREKHLDLGWDLLEQGEFAGALSTACALLEEQPEDPEALYLAGCAHLEMDEPDLAERMLRAALSQTDGPAPARVTLAMALHRMCRFDEAAALAQEALQSDPHDADAWHIRGLALEMAGRDAEAADCLERSARLDPGRFRMPELMTQERFDAVVAEGLAGLPAEFRARLGDLPIVVRELPSPEILAHLDDPVPDLLGLFVGTPLTEKSISDTPGLPDAIYLFRRNLQRSCLSEEELKEEIRTTLLHEIGHYLGMTEEDLEAAGYE